MASSLFTLSSIFQSLSVPLPALVDIFAHVSILQQSDRRSAFLPRQFFLVRFLQHLQPDTGLFVSARPPPGPGKAYLARE